jgi:hypothetical protein
VGALLNHETAKSLRNHKRDNVLAMREKARQLRARREEEAAQKKPDFKLKQFENVPSRVHREPPRSPSTPSRPSSAALGRPEAGESALSNASVSKQPRRASTGSPQCQTPPRSSGWRVSSGYGSLSSPPNALFTPPSRFEPPSRVTPKAAQARSYSTPVKATRSRKAAKSSPGSDWSPGDGGRASWSDEEVGFDITNFEKAAKQLNQMQGKRTPAKDAQGGPTRLQCNRNRSPSPGLLWHIDGPDLDIPSGFRLAPEDERRDTLQRLQEKLADLSDKYNRLPLRIETEGQRKQQDSLRTKIAETERAVQMFSRSRVLVKTEYGEPNDFLQY